MARIQPFLTQFLLLLLVLLGFAGTGIAATCDMQSVIQAGSPGIGTVKQDAGPRLNFQKSGPQCPGGEGCQAKAYLVPGDTVLFSDAGDGWVCAWYGSFWRATTGWLPRAALQPGEQDAPADLESWTGTWVSGDQGRVVITRTPDGKLRFEGTAIGQGKVDPDITGFDLIAAPAKELTYRRGACAVRIRWMYDALMITDTDDCAAQDARFNGLYRRASMGRGDCSIWDLTHVRNPALGSLKPDVTAPVPFGPEQERPAGPMPVFDPAQGYLQPGERVFAWAIGRDWTCVYRPGANHGTSGWMPTRLLTINRAPPVPDAKDWIGYWKRLDTDDEVIKVEILPGPDKRLVRIDGVAGSPSGMGDLNGNAEFDGRHLIYPDGQCRVVFTWIDGMMLADDVYAYCSGLGVTFSGLYRKQAK